MDRVILLSAAPFKFKAEDTGREIEGVSLQYVDPSMVSTSGDRLGSAPMKASIPAADYHKVRVVPGVYDFDFRLRPGAGGKATVRLADVKFVAAVDLVEVVELATAAVPVSSSK